MYVCVGDAEAFLDIGTPGNQVPLRAAPFCAERGGVGHSEGRGDVRDQPSGPPGADLVLLPAEVRDPSLGGGGALYCAVMSPETP